MCKNQAVLTFHSMSTRKLGDFCGLLDLLMLTNSSPLFSHGKSHYLVISVPLSHLPTTCNTNTNVATRELSGVEFGYWLLKRFFESCNGTSDDNEGGSEDEVCSISLSPPPMKSSYSDASDSLALLLAG